LMGGVLDQKHEGSGASVNIEAGWSQQALGATRVVFGRCAAVSLELP